MSENIDRRNFLGGFLGGALGILGSSSISVVALPFGCVFGAMIGFWWQELANIPKMVKAESKKIKRREHLKHLLVYHPANIALRRIYTGRILAVMTIVGVVIWIGKYHNLIAGFESMFIAFITTLIVLILTLGFRTDSGSPIVGIEYNKGNLNNFNELNDTRKIARIRGYYSLLELNDKWGAWLSIREFIIVLGIACFIPFILVFFICCVLIFGCLIAIPVVFVNLLGLIIEITHKIVTSKSYWLCVMVTFITTGSIVYFKGIELEGMGLWLVAFSAGFASGLLSILVSKLIQKVISPNSKAEKFLIKLIVTMKNATDYVEIILSSLRRFFITVFSPPRFQYGIWKYVR